MPRSHFTRRARGQRSDARGGDLFRGRAAALAAVGGWLTDPDDQGRPLVVTGQPGAGKSAVLARAVLGVEAGKAGPGWLSTPAPRPSATCSPRWPT